jgi:hypothetical protein
MDGWIDGFKPTAAAAAGVEAVSQSTSTSNPSFINSNTYIDCLKH